MVDDFLEVNNFWIFVYAGDSFVLADFKYHLIMPKQIAETRLCTEETQVSQANHTHQGDTGTQEKEFQGIISRQ